MGTGLLGRLWKWALALLLALLFFLGPPPQVLSPLVSYLLWGVGALFTVCLLGKLLYDTLFYGRYWP